MLRPFAVFFVCLIMVFFCGSAYASTKHALLIGIDNYIPRPDASNKTLGKGRKEIKNLKGAVNDVLAMEKLLRTNYGFEKITILKNEQATRAQILFHLENTLLKNIQAGDTVVFHYSGHGSLQEIEKPKADKQTPNKENELDGYDETIVPADSLLGVDDITDNHLSDVFHRILDKKAILTAIFDSCHSGGMTRGIPSFAQSRDAESNDSITKEVFSPRAESLQQRGAVILSAAQSHEKAWEKEFEILEDQQVKTFYRGAFTWALEQKLKAAPNFPISVIFSQVDSMLTDQKPKIDALPEKLNTPFLGSQALSKQLVLTVKKINEQNQSVLIAGGSSIGLTPGAILYKQVDNQKFKLKVTKVNGLIESEGVVYQPIGKPQAFTINDFKPGDILEIEHLGSPLAYQVLHFWMPPALQANEFEKLKQISSELSKQKNISLVQDPTVQSPTHTLLKSHNGWILVNHLSKQHNYGKTLNPEPILKDLIEQAKSEKMRVFLSYPPPQSLREELSDQFKEINIAKLHEKIENADYYLMGTQYAYAWIRHSATDSKELQKLTLFSSLPARTDWIKPNGEILSDLLPAKAPEPQSPSHSNLASKLFDYCKRLAKLKALLTLNPPIQPATENSSYFPFDLALKKINTTDVIDPQKEPVTATSTYQFVLKRIENMKTYQHRYVYIIAVDSHGKSFLWFPTVEQAKADENFLPQEKHKKDAEITFTTYNLNIGPPYGVDTYILLSTTEPIPPLQLDVFNQDGVYTDLREVRKGLNNSLAELFSNIQDPNGATKRSAPSDIPNWGVSYLSVLSTE